MGAFRMIYFDRATHPEKIGTKHLQQLAMDNIDKKANTLLSL